MLAGDVFQKTQRGRLFISFRALLTIIVNLLIVYFFTPSVSAFYRF